ncbi:MAG: hypothetical protein QOD93_3176 [Acetobacteraceae bacterium]|nr:hypothetical protein [Acetobacteraceae bacterium]
MLRRGSGANTDVGEEVHLSVNPGAGSISMQVRLMKRHHPGTEQLDTRSAVHGPFDGFQLIDLSLCLQPWSNGAFPLSGVAGSWGPMGA